MDGFDRMVYGFLAAFVGFLIVVMVLVDCSDYQGAEILDWDLDAILVDAEFLKGKGYDALAIHLAEALEDGHVYYKEYHTLKKIRDDLVTEHRISKLTK